MSERQHMRVNHMYSQNGENHEKHIPVDSVEEAIEVIEKRADEQVNDESVAWNVLSCEVFDKDTQEWEDYYSEDGLSIDELLEEKRL